VETNQTWAQRVTDATPRLTKLEKKVVQFITDQPHIAAFLSMQKMGEAVGVSKPKIIDLYRKLNYPDYKAFRHGILTFYSLNINSFYSSEATFKHVHTLDQLVAVAVAADTEALNRLQAHISMNDLRTLVQAILQAQDVFLYGPGTGMYPAHYLYQRLRRYRIHTNLVRQDEQHLMEELLTISRKAVLIVFDYSLNPKRTVQVMRFAHDRGARVFLVTGTIIIDYIALVEQTFYVERGSMRMKSSMAVPMMFANLLILTLELLGGEELREALREGEKDRETYQLGW
jgi:DNA-binding MurR/RpiR family transcriptional regulator